MSNEYETSCPHCLLNIPFDADLLATQGSCPSCSHPVTYLPPIDLNPDTIQNAIPPVIPLPENTSIKDQERRPFRRFSQLGGPQSTRPSMQYNAFKRYEIYIAIAQHGSFYLNPTTERSGRSNRPLTQHSMACAFRDALLGFHRHSHPSTIIPKSFSYEAIKINEDSDSDNIFVENINLRSYLKSTQVQSYYEQYHKQREQNWQASGSIEGLTTL